MSSSDHLFQLSSRILDELIETSNEATKMGLPRTTALGSGLETCLNLLTREYSDDEVALMLIELARKLRKREMPEHGTVLQILGEV